MYFKGLLAHSDVVSETVYLAAENFFLAHKGAQLAYPDSRIVWLFPVEDDEVPAYIRGKAEEHGWGRELLNLSRHGL